jgi:hypothetical protein
MGGCPHCRRRARPCRRAGDEDKKQAELKWARGVAADLLPALKRDDEEAAEALLTAEYARLLTVRDTLKHGAGRLLRAKTGAADKASITAAEISPDGDEARFEEELIDASGTRPIVLRVVKEKESGRWRVGYVQVGEERPREKPTEPKK